MWQKHLTAVNLCNDQRIVSQRNSVLLISRLLQMVANLCHTEQDGDPEMSIFGAVGIGYPSIFGTDR